jgi:hypothetical protein
MTSSPDNSPIRLPRGRSPATRAGLALIRCYQRWLSGLKPPICRFSPTCSEYAAQAIAHRGLLRGSLLALWRLLRCHPFSRGGSDPGPWHQEGADNRS